MVPQALVQRPPNFVRFCQEELKEIARLTETPSRDQTQLPAVIRKKSL